MRIPLTLSALLLMAASPLAAHAAVANFTYSGLDTGAVITPGTSATLGSYVQWEGGIDSGTISFTYAGAPSTLDLSSITSFSITRSMDFIAKTTYANNPMNPTIFDFGAFIPGYRATYTQDISSLTNFSAAIAADGTVTALNFLTTPVLPAGGTYLYANGLQGSGSGGVLSYDSTTTAPTYPSGIYTAGAITQVVPEPASLGILGASALALVARRRRA